MVFMQFMAFAGVDSVGTLLKPTNNILDFLFTLQDGQSQVGLNYGPDSKLIISWSVSAMRFIIETIFILKAIKYHFQRSNDKQSYTRGHLV